MRIAVCTLLAGSLLLIAADSDTWRFDRLDRIGGQATTILGHPHLVDTPAGKAVEFNGIDDAIFVGVHPLAGAATFTWEVVFRPASGGSPEQRFFHLQEVDATTGKDTDTRMLMEIRIIDGRWALDSFALSNANSRALLDRTKLHSLDAWHHVAAVYDGREFRNYVDGVLEGSGELLNWKPQGAGRSSVGVRINKVDYFKGAIYLSRTTRRALKPAEFLRSPL